ncbi:MAG: hypothetical protein COT71_00225 [Candidatus Andersenbacteria bacterium CG10_big_fil_rev_8_21_14_0_10_54_11]|uniref:Polyprenol-phosphate-mannose--protein mannosyltransferase n=1 Tax=Candidatus Andersenbacteria bacterium CG10_big_fil_rev_8_21_14_0_10_54_11 TaxID=1974485 RepID=A0A2M6X0C4_9BACT|nr:MAG: hypothetical protein COT71_00225 [Candidatus Andersenbacteria bacterium CG10_big_fil_rev_8_21_14_0_10_54_11]
MISAAELSTDASNKSQSLHWVQERRWLLLLLFFGIAFHVPGLVYPREVVFDEVHFGKFVTAYCCTHERFFDIHPPHAKLLIAATAYLAGYRGGVPFEHIGQPYGPVSPLPLRLFPALMGIVLPLVIYWLIRELGGGAGAAFFGGTLVTLDTAVLVQTRIIALDGLLLTALFGSLAAYMAAERCLLQRARGWIRWMVLAGAMAGLAAGTKFTGLVAAGLLGVVLIGTLPLRPASRWVSAVAAVTASALAVYAAGWALHFVLLPLPGDGDAWGVPNFSGAPLPISFVREVWKLHEVMLSANTGLAATHPNASAWYTWPFMAEPVFYWQHGPMAPGRAGVIYFIGNPAVWWGVSFMFLAAVFSVLLTWADWLRLAARRGVRAASRGARRLFNEPLFLLLVGFALSLVPLTGVHRVLFLYHYLTPLLFSLLFVVLWLERVGWIQPGGVRVQSRWYVLVLFSTAAFFIFFSPLAYGWAVPAEWLNHLYWLSGWR